MVSCLREIVLKIERPSTIIVVSGHWEEGRPTITSGENPGLIYDYSGFPKASYEISYPCPGAPCLARSIAEHLDKAGIDAGLDEARGFDHGLFMPLKIMFPNADIPCVQLSLIKSLDPAEHIQLGCALQDLGDQSMLLIGSGFSFHNMRALMAPDTDATGDEYVIRRLAA